MIGVPNRAWLDPFALLIFTSTVTFFGEWLLLRVMVRGGVIESGGSLRGRAIGTNRIAASNTTSSVQRRWRESLARTFICCADRNMFIGTLIVPIVIIGMQLAFNPAVLRHGFFDLAISRPWRLAWPPMCSCFRPSRS